MDYGFFLSKDARRRTPSFLRQLIDGLGGIDDSYIILAGGLPSETVFPFRSAELTLRDSSTVEVNEADMATCLQYGVTAGYPELVDWVSKLTRLLHDPPTAKTLDHPGKLQTILTNGALDGIYKTVTSLMDEGDTLLTEEPVFSSFLNIVSPIGCHVVPIKTDERGIVPESLEMALSLWPKPDDTRPALGKLKALYVVPNGGNPTGSRYSLDRRRAIYRLAHEYNFLIIEDDAYYFLEERPLSPSFLSMDVDGRVIRIDTFSKTIAPGLRIGYVSGPTPIVTKILFLSQCSSQGCAGISQMVLLQVLRKMGHDGYLKHCAMVEKHYSKKRNLCVQIAKKHLEGLASWYTPTGGMFLWIKFTGLEDSFHLIMEKLVKRKVLFVAGKACNVSEKLPCPYARVSFSLASEEDMEKGFKILAEELRNLRGLRN